MRYERGDIFDSLYQEWVTVESIFRDHRDHIIEQKGDSVWCTCCNEAICNGQIVERGGRTRA